MTQKNLVNPEKKYIIRAVDFLFSNLKLKVADLKIQL